MSVSVIHVFLRENIPHQCFINNNFLFFANSFSSRSLFYFMSVFDVKFSRAIETSKREPKVNFLSLKVTKTQFESLYSQ